jgi:hypothetical protein
MQENTFMRTTLDLPDDLLRRAKIAAVERGSSLRQLVLDALAQELEGPAGVRRQRMTRAPVTLAADAPLRTLGVDELKRLDMESVEQHDLARAHALHR